MKRIDRKTVELTDDEMAIRMMFEENLSAGMNIRNAAKEALAAYCQMWPKYMDTLEGAFVRYISDGTLRWRPSSRTLIDHDE